MSGFNSEMASLNADEGGDRKQTRVSASKESLFCWKRKVFLNL